MTCKKSAALVLVVLSFVFRLSAQVNTDFGALQAGASRSALRERLMSSRLSQLAVSRGWPLQYRLRNGNRAVLYGIDPKGMPKYVTVQNNIISAATIGTDKLWPGGSTGLDLNGGSDTLKSRIALWDGGAVRGTHQELTGRVLQKDNVTELSDHSTHVSGTLIASGVNPAAKGMSFAAQQLLAYDYNNDVSEMFAAAPGLLISNHSYGTVAGWNFNTDRNRWEFYGDPGDTVDFKFGYYDDQSAAWDSIAYHAPYYLIVKSGGNNRDVNGPAVGQPYYRYNSSGVLIPAGNRPAGISNNDGYDIIPTYGVAKNILVVGAVNPIPGGYTRPADVVQSSFNSWGPTDDGRIKPDVVTDGVDVLSSISTSNNAYAIYSGTSMASPAAAGSGFLLQEYYARKHHTFMRSATLKGLIIHTADEAGPANGPDYQNGYGLVDMPKAASVITSANTDQRIRESSLASGSSYTEQDTASGKGPLIVTLSWTDPAGPVDENNILNNPARKLVNDLDVKVVGNGTTYYPWVLDRLHPGNAATTGIDTLNNIEKIVISNPVAGKPYTITVSHKGTLKNGSQAYSLISSGVGGGAYCVSAPASSAGTRIDEVDMSNLTNVNPAGCTTYTDYTSKTINLQSSQILPFTVKLSSCDGSTASKVVKIFIDYNNNGVFTDPGETVAVSTVLSGTADFTGSITVPAGKVPGTSTVMRVVAEETTDPNTVLPCGTYGKGETQDYRILFTALTRDITPDAVVDPLSGVCVSDSQRVTIRLKNLGTVDQSNVPVTLKITSGGTTLVNTATTCPLTIPAQGNVTYTFQPAFHPVAGQNYVITVGSALAGDQDPGNDTGIDTLKVSAGSATTITGTAAICSTTPPLAGLKANTSDSSNAVLWYDSPTSTTPIAGGIQATTTVIPPNDQPYYMGLNEGIASVGPKTKLAYPSGGYNVFQGNFIRFHNDVPVTLNSTRLYVSHGGNVTFTVADVASFDSCNGGYSYFVLSSNTVSTYATTPNPQAGAVSGNSALDTGAVFLLNLAVPTTGDHIIIVVADDSTSLFRNNGLTTKPYPFGVPGVFTITGNSAIDVGNCADTSFYQAYYYFFYDLKVTLANCPSPRVAVKPSQTAAPAITRIGNHLSSNFNTGNHWYFNDTAIAGATKDTVTLQGPGSYKTVVLDSLGCTLESNVYVYTPGDDIGLSAYPSPSDGNFTVQFYMTRAENVSLKIFNLLGSEIYSADYGTTNGSVIKPIHLGAPSAGMYVLKLQVGGKKYTRKIMVK